MPHKKGDKIGRYHVEEIIGQGGFAFVYKVRDLVTDEVFAIKEFVENDNLPYKALAQKEYQLARRLEHANIVEVTDLIKGEDTYYVVMPYASNTLHTILQYRKQLPWRDALLLMRHILEGVAYLHKNGIVHCDLKPKNILFFGDRFMAEIADLGIAHEKDSDTTSGLTRLRAPAGAPIDVSPEQREKEDASPSIITDLQGPVGTYPYMPPEQKKGIRDRYEIDVYALGVIFVQMLVGLGYDPEIDILEERLKDVEGLPSSFIDFIKKALAPNPDDRYRNAGQMLDALEAIIIDKKPPWWKHSAVSLGTAIAIMALVVAIFTLRGNIIELVRAKPSSTPPTIPLTTTAASTPESVAFTQGPPPTLTITLTAKNNDTPKPIPTPTHTPISTPTPTPTPHPKPQIVPGPDPGNPFTHNNNDQCVFSFQWAGDCIDGENIPEYFTAMNFELRRGQGEGSDEWFGTTNITAIKDPKALSCVNNISRFELQHCQDAPAITGRITDDAGVVVKNLGEYPAGAPLYWRLIICDDQGKGWWFKPGGQDGELESGYCPNSAVE